MATPFTTLQSKLSNLPKSDFSQVSLPKISMPKMSLPDVRIPSIHSIDLTKFDLSQVTTALKIDDIVESAPVKTVRDAGYTAIGFGVLAFQKAQVRRRELTDALKSRFNTAQ
jgi:hypothetical protein